MDARGVKGSWESAVFFVNQEKTGAIRKLAADAQWFEDRMPWIKEYRKPNVTGDHGQRHRGRDRDRRLRADHADRDQPAERPGDSRAVREQVGLALERPGVERQVDPDRVPRRVRLEPRGTGPRDEVERAGGRTAGQHARGDRPRLGPGRPEAQGEAAGPAQGAVLGPGRGRAPTSSPSTSCPTPSWPSSAWSKPKTRRRSPGRPTRATPATPWCSFAGSARGRRSRKTTCGTGRWSSAG